MRLWLKWVLGIAVMVILLVAGAAIYVSRLDPTAHDAMIRNAVRDATGRELETDGEVRLRLLPAPSMEAAGVRFSNAPWASQPDMARVKLARIQIAWLPLLKGRIVMKKVVIIEPEIFLETDAKGRTNWEFKPADEQAEVASTEKAPEGLGLSINSVQIENARVTYRNNQTQKTIDVVVDELLAESTTPVTPVNVRLRASYQNLPIELDGRWGDRGAFLSNEPLEPDLKGKLGDAEFTVKGAVEKPLQGKGLKLDIGFQTESTKWLTDLAGIDLGEFGPLEAKARLRRRKGEIDIEGIELSARPRDAELDLKGSIASVMSAPKPDLEFTLSAKTLRQLYTPLPDVGPVKVSASVGSRGDFVEVKTFKATAGENDLEGSMTVDLGSKPPSARAKLRAEIVHLDQLTPSPADPNERTKEPSPDDGRIFSDEPLPFASLAEVNADIDFAAKNLVGPRFTLSDVRLELKLKNKNLTVKPAFQVAGGSVSGRINVDAGQQPATIALTLNGKKVELGAISEELRGEKLLDGGLTDIKIDVNANGDSLRAIMAGLDGDVSIAIGEGNLRNDHLDRFGGDIFMGLLSSVVPTSEQETTTTVRCAVGRFSARDGFATADQTVVIETDKVMLKGGGTVDLASERLDMGGNIAARKGVRVGAGTLSSLVRVQGTLAEPKLATDLKGVVTAGAKVGAAIATMGISVVAEDVFGDSKGDPHPCKTALARKFEPRERGSKRDPIIALPGGKNAQEDAVAAEKGGEEAVHEAVEEPSKDLEAIGSGIKSLFK